MGGAPLLCLFEKESGYRLSLRSVYMHGVNPFGSSNALLRVKVVKNLD